MSDNYVLQSSQNPDPSTDLSQVGANALTPDPSITAPTTTSDDVSNQLPMPDQSAPSTPDQPAAPQQAAPQPAKPSLWRSVLAGALQGLAAGGSVNTKGMSGGSAFAAGAGAGANQVLNKVPAQNAELDQAKAQVAFAHANTAHIMQTVAAMNEQQQNKYIDQAADHSEAGFESGAYVPIAQPFDNYTDAQKAYHDETLKNPWEVGAVVPVRGPDGGIQYSVVKSTRSPLQKDWTIAGGSADGSDLTIPAGTPADAAVKVYLANQSKKLETDQKTSLQNDKIAGQEALKGTPAAPKPSDGIPAGAKMFKKDADALAKTEGTYSMFNDVLNDINSGKDVTGAKSVVALFNAIGLSATPLQGMGMRINNNTVQEHINARGLGGSLYQKLLSVKNGDVITPQQIKDYADIAATARRDAYVNKINEARNYGLDPSFLMPQGNGRGLDLNTAQIFLSAANGDKDQARKLAASKGWKF